MTGTLPAVLEPMVREAEERFLDLVASTGNSTAAARAVGFHRNTFYKRASVDADFRARWEAAQAQSRSNISQELVEKAMVLSGRIVEEPVLDANGDPVLDDDLEPVTVRRLQDYDPRILAKMIDRFVASEDGAPVTAVQVNLPPSPPPPPAPPRVARLVYASDGPAIDAAPSVAERVTEASWEPGE